MRVWPAGSRMRGRLGTCCSAQFSRNRKAIIPVPEASFGRGSHDTTGSLVARYFDCVALPHLDAHENGPRCAQISGPTVGARQRSPAVDLLVANEGWVIVLCQDRSRRRRWPKASLYKGLSPSHARPTDGHVGVCPARGCPRETRQSAPGWWVRKMSTPWVHSRERQGLGWLSSRTFRTRLRSWPCPLLFLTVGACRKVATILHHNYCDWSCWFSLIGVASFPSGDGVQCAVVIIDRFLA